MTLQPFQFPAPGTRPPRTMPPALRDPLRAAILAGAALMILGTLLPWIRAWKPGTGWFDVSGFQQAGDGGIVLELAILAGALVWSNRAWRSRMALIIMAPALLGISSLAVMRASYETSTTFLRLLTNAGGYGSFQLGFWLTIAGAAVTVVAGGVAIWHARHRLAISPRGTGRVVAGALGAMVGGVGGFITGSQVADLLTRASAVGASAILIALAFTLAFVGAWLGAVIATGAVRALQRP
ncbi:MAG: hypothetical protein V4515_05780 [Chloroflexota bacterium]